MNKDGKKILEAVRQMKKIFGDISLLLREVDSIMEREEWLSKTGSTIWSYGSQSIYNPDRWMPNELFRFYWNKEYPYYLVFVSILLDNDIEEDYYTIEEPLITAGFFDYGGKKIDKNEWKKYWYARWYGYIDKEKRKNDGKPILVNPKKDWGEDWHPFKSSYCFGLPLTSIKNYSDVENKIVKPLIELLKGKRK
jgi:hypothetical protein